MASPVAPRDRGTDLGMIARVSDCWLGGSYPLTVADREFVRNVEIVAPHIPYQVRAQRAMLGRMVRYLAAQGIRQFLDLGSGVPTQGHIHEIMHEVAPGESRIVYVDADPGFARDAQAVVKGHDGVVYLEADLRRSQELLESLESRGLLDFTQPVAVLFIGTLVEIDDADDPDAVVASYVEAVCPGSYLGIAHTAKDKPLEEGIELSRRMFQTEPPAVFLRGPERQAKFFAGLEMVEPGITPVQLWKPDPGADVDRNAEYGNVFGGLARKP